MEHTPLKISQFFTASLNSIKKYTLFLAFLGYSFKKEYKDMYIE